MATIELTAETFESTVLNNDIVIVDFWAPWCGPCRSFAPVYEHVAAMHRDIVFAKVNSEQEPALAAQFSIRSIPTLMVFREQIILYSQAGALPASSLENVVAQTLALDMEQVRAEMVAKAEQA